MPSLTISISHRHSLLSLLFTFTLFSLLPAEEFDLFKANDAPAAAWGFTPLMTTGSSRNGFTYSEMDDRWLVCDVLDGARNYLVSSFIELYNRDDASTTIQGNIQILEIQISVQEVQKEESPEAGKCENQGSSCKSQLHGRVHERTEEEGSMETFKFSEGTPLQSRDHQGNSVVDTALDPSVYSTYVTTYRVTGNRSQRPGVYLKLNDTGTCVFITRVKISSKYCKSTKNSLVEFPDHWSAPYSMVRVPGKCVAGAEFKKGFNGDENFCKPDGHYTNNDETDKCQCSAGKQPNNLESPTYCQDCSTGYYKSTVGNHMCSKCPENSSTRGMTGSPACSCNSGHYRPKNFSVDQPCSKPPSAPRNLEHSVVNTIVQLSWERPEEAGANIWYTIQCFFADLGQGHYPAAAAEGANTSRETRFEVLGLEPNTNYRCRVSSHNQITEDNKILEPFYAEAFLTTGNKVKVHNVRVRDSDSSGDIELTWDLVGSTPLYYTVITTTESGKTTVRTSDQQYTMQSLPAGLWKFQICAVYDSDQDYKVCSENQELSINIDSSSLHAISPRNLAIAAAMLIGIILTMLVVLVLAVCCYRRSAAKWTLSSGGAIYGGHTLGGLTLMDVGGGGGGTLHMDHSALTGTLNTIYTGSQAAFIDPAYYDDIEKILVDFTRELQPNQLQIFSDSDSGLDKLSGEMGDVIRELPEKEGEGQGQGQGQGQAWLMFSDNQRSRVKVKYCDESNAYKLRHFALEAAVGSQFYHPNVLLVHGVIYQGTRLAMCVEHTGNPPLDQYLRSGPGQSLNQLQLVHLLRGVACGMQYLSELGYIHKVLKASNVEVSVSGVCKVSGFDQRAVLEEEDLQGHTHIFQSIVGWAAPEVIAYRKYSSASDSWAFGTLAWETLSKGHTPFATYMPQQIVKSVTESDYRLPPPEGASQYMYDVISGCWQRERTHRLGFSHIKDLLEKAIRCPAVLNSGHDNLNYFPTKAAAAPDANNPNGAEFHQMNIPGNHYDTQTLVNSPSGLYSFNSVLDWLRSLNLEQYNENFGNCDYYMLEDILTITQNQTLENMGVKSSKHRKQMMSSIEGIRSKLSPIPTLGGGVGGGGGGQYTSLLKPDPYAKNSAVHCIM